MGTRSKGKGGVWIVKSVVTLANTFPVSVFLSLQSTPAGKWRLNPNPVFTPKQHKTQASVGCKGAGSGRAGHNKILFQWIHSPETIHLAAASLINFCFLNLGDVDPWRDNSYLCCPRGGENDLVRDGVRVRDKEGGSSIPVPGR